MNPNLQRPLPKPTPPTSKPPFHHHQLDNSTSSSSSLFSSIFLTRSPTNIIILSVHHNHHHFGSTTLNTIFKIFCLGRNPRLAKTLEGFWCDLVFFSSDLQEVKERVGSTGLGFSYIGWLTKYERSGVLRPSFTFLLRPKRFFEPDAIFELGFRNGPYGDKILTTIQDPQKGVGKVPKKVVWVTSVLPRHSLTGNHAWYLFRVVVGCRKITDAWGVGSPTTRSRSVRKYEDSDENPNSDLAVVKKRRYHFNDKTFIHPLHSIRFDPDRPYELPVESLLALRRRGPSKNKDSSPQESGPFRRASPTLQHSPLSPVIRHGSPSSPSKIVSPIQGQ
ncbi:hypothetical protein PIB30_058574 [Stylosanthes scabra]|uniref:Uncharacterized protein n=1 Tax=Stylosanthes scabra TaxID=79078 RepID=A0ABU6QKM0_9FABA|nr:hypothetical protein [Stylosanthes scabra]